MSQTSRATKGNGRKRQSFTPPHYLPKPDEPEPNVGRAMPDMVGAAHPTVMALSLGKFYWFSSSIVIIIALDIVFPEIIPNLYLDDMQRLAAPIFQTVPGTDRDVGALIFLHGGHFITLGDCCP